jgi:polysaccharide pyruvyl transferase WcaK-like protein
MSNLGDIALLQVAVDRIRTHFPSARISVITRSEHELARHIRGVSAVRIDYPVAWHRLRSLVSARAPADNESLLAQVEAYLSRRLPAGFRRRLAHAVEEHDLVVHAGSGVLADPFVSAATRRLILFEQAIRQGKPTAILGQGIGPLESRQLRQALLRVLPKVDLLSVRDPMSARLLSEDLHMDGSSIPVTGDDALELALPRQQARLGRDIGFNLRFSGYSGFSATDTSALTPLVEVLGGIARAMGGAIVPVVVDISDSPVRQWVSHSELPDPAQRLNDRTVDDLLRTISGCRLVVTASFHAAVLALGQGIPAVCLHRTAYYWRKFSGLAEMFPKGCALIDMTGPITTERFIRTAEQLLEDSGKLRSELVDVTHEAVLASRRVYQRLPEVLSNYGWAGLRRPVIGDIRDA